MDARTGTATASGPVRTGSWQAWMVALRPQSLPVAVSPVLVGATLGYARDGAIDALAAVLVLAAALLMQLITNLQNDVGFTVRNGAGAVVHSGLPRATTRGWLGVREVRAAIVGLSLVAVAVGLALVAYRGWPVLAIGTASLVAALAYMGGPRPIAYTPFGELTVFVFFGLVAVLGTDWVLTGGIGAATALAAVAIGSLAAAALAVNNQRDIVHDRLVGRRTFAVALGERASQHLFGVLLLHPVRPAARDGLVGRFVRHAAAAAAGARCLASAARLCRLPARGRLQTAAAAQLPARTLVCRPAGRGDAARQAGVLMATHCIGRRAVLASLVGGVTLPSEPALGQDGRPSTFPARTVRLVVPYSVGTGPDVVARSLAERLTQQWGQPVLVDNKPGASGIVAFAEVRRTAPDGHTLFLADTATLAVNPLLHAALPYDPVRDLVPLTLAVSRHLRALGRRPRADSPTWPPCWRQRAARRARQLCDAGQWPCRPTSRSRPSPAPPACRCCTYLSRMQERCCRP